MTMQHSFFFRLKLFFAAIVVMTLFNYSWPGNVREL